jgi:hypothetical protein
MQSQLDKLNKKLRETRKQEKEKSQSSQEFRDMPYRHIISDAEVEGEGEDTMISPAQISKKQEEPYTFQRQQRGSNEVNPKPEFKGSFKNSRD